MRKTIKEDPVCKDKKAFTYPEDKRLPPFRAAAVFYAAAPDFEFTCPQGRINRAACVYSHP